MVRIMMIDSLYQSRLNLQEPLNSPDLYKVVASVANLKEAIQVLNDDTNIDLIVLDSHTTRINSKRNLIEIQQQYPKVKILILPLEQELKQPLIGAEVRGLIFKNKEFEAMKNDLSEPVKKVQDTANDKLPFKITLREWDVLKLILKEYSNQEIAEKLFISRRTVEAHKRNLLSKTNSKNLVGLVLFSIKHNLV